MKPFSCQFQESPCARATPAPMAGRATETPSGTDVSADLEPKEEAAKVGVFARKKY